MVDAIARENMPGYKAGNQVIDAFYENVRKSISKLSGLIEIKKRYALEEAKILLKRKSTDNRRIECTLDSLLELVEWGEAEKEFQSLVNYYSQVNKKGANFYRKEYAKLKQESE